MRLFRFLFGLSLASGLFAQMPSSDFSYGQPPLKVEQLKVEEKQGVRIRHLQFNSVEGKPIAAYQVEPVTGCGIKRSKCAGILFAHWYEPKAANGNRAEFLPEAYDLAHHGAVSLLVDTMWSDAGWFAQRNPSQDVVASMNQVKNLRRALDVLLRREGIDYSRIAFVGHDFGAMYGMIFAGVDHRVRASVFMTAATCLSDWFLLNRPADENEQRKMESELKPLCPVSYLPHVTGPVFLQFGDGDPYVPANAAQTLAEAAPEPKKVRFYEGGHVLNGQARMERLEWLALRLNLKSQREE